jgi:hypothetical protein
VRQTLGRYGLLIPLLAGALLLAIAEFLTLYEIRVITAVPEGGTYAGGPHHGYALLVIAIALVPMSIGAVIGGSRPAALAALALSLAAVVVVLAVDLPDLNETGLIGRTYEAAEAQPSTGFFLESLGAALALVGSVGTLVLGAGRRPERPPRERAGRADRERARRERRERRAQASEGRPGPAESSSDSSTTSVDSTRSASA